MAWQYDQNGNAYLDDGKKVGIGTPTPETYLQVKGPDSNSTQTLLDVRAKDAAGVVTAALAVRVAAGTPAVLLRTGGINGSPVLQLAGDSDTPAITLQNDGVVYVNSNLGVGTPTPNAKLDVEVTGNGDALLLTLTATDPPRMRLGFHTTTGFPYVQAIRDGAYGPQSLLLNPSGGNVGVGVTAPTAKLDVAGDVKASSSITTATKFVAPSGLTGGRPTYSFAGIDDTTGMYTDGDGTLRLLGNGVVRLSIDSDGNVGIGPIDADAKLHVEGDILARRLTLSSPSVSPAFEVVAPGLGGVIIDTQYQLLRPLSPDQYALGVNGCAWHELHIGTGNSDFIGKVRIGSATAPAHTLDVTGDIRATEGISTAGAIGASGGIGTDGGLTVALSTRLYGDVYVGPGQQKLAFNSQGQVLYA